MVTPTGAKIWRLRYRHEGKEQTLTLGSYPYVSLLDAREIREKTKSEIRKGQEPEGAKKALKQVPQEPDIITFENVARDWFNLYKNRWVNIQKRCDWNIAYL